MNDRVKRICLATLGVICVSVAAIGAVLPGIPTLGPLLFGSLLLAKSNPALEKRLIRNKFFAKYLPYIDGEKEMTPKVKWTAAAMMWTSICISSLVMYYFTSAPKWVIPSLPIAGVIGSFAIWRYGKNAAKP